jgi:hypothetical protein
MATRSLTAARGHFRASVNPFAEGVYTIPWCFELIHRILCIAITQRHAYDHIFVVRYIEEFFDVIPIGIDEADGAGGETEALCDKHKITKCDADRVFKSLRFLTEAHEILRRDRR